MAYAFTAAEVEDGTGKTTALVWEQPTTTATWLSDRGKTSFSAAADAAQKTAALRATEEISDELLRLGFNGAPIVDGQTLLYPAYGAYRQDGRTIDSDTIPRELLEAYRLAAEEIAAGTWLPSSAQPTNLRRIKKAGAEAEFFATSSPGSISLDHPEIARRLRTVAGRRLAA